MIKREDCCATGL